MSVNLNFNSGFNEISDSVSGQENNYSNEKNKKCNILSPSTTIHDLNLVHWTDKKIDLRNFRKIKQIEGGFKPRGLWFSPEKDTYECGSDCFLLNWEQFCKNDQYPLGDLKYRVEFKDKTKAAFLKTANDVSKFYQKFKASNPLFPTDVINWNDVSNSFDVVLIVPFDKAYASDTNWHHLWDCDSGVVLNPECIKGITLLSNSNEESNNNNVEETPNKSDTPPSSVVLQESQIESKTVEGPKVAKQKKSAFKTNQLVIVNSSWLSKFVDYTEYSSRYTKVGRRYTSITSYRENLESETIEKTQNLSKEYFAELRKDLLLREAIHYLAGYREVDEDGDAIRDYDDLYYATSRLCEPTDREMEDIYDTVLEYYSYHPGVMVNSKSNIDEDYVICKDEILNRLQEKIQNFDNYPQSANREEYDEKLNGLFDLISRKLNSKEDFKYTLSKELIKAFDSKIKVKMADINDTLVEQIDESGGHWE